MGFTKSHISLLADTLKSLPDISHTNEITKQEAVKLLSREITSLRKRGYSLEQVAQSLKDGGIDISTPTLKNYLQRTRTTFKNPEKSSRKFDKNKECFLKLNTNNSPGSFNVSSDTPNI